ncbi:PadR family transcriptional regulator [Lederbergia sp. NSJ-179]|uniref:PadR family transcriptional regulator n=1 Tax=Lederbergia sp. NSJ-179 TaxID=2931402 RepID=UPI001FD38675|nr:PadR family transcriptional regulator [Lederbergia sp. NSJ-179]MCJ7840732.1 PadR family transcriptional regulator [Lederbergia sp. NSJ-179]
MFKKHDMPQHPFFKGQGHFHHNDFFGGNRFNKEPFKSKGFGMENGNFKGQGGPHFFAGKGSGGDHSGERFFKRGDIKIVLLKLLQEQPRHGYELIKALEEKFKGFYSPSPGSVYPTLQMLEDQDLVNITREGRKKVYHLTDEGRAYLEKHQNEDPIISRMNMFENVDLDEMQTLRFEMKGLFHEFVKVGRQSMENPEKKEQLQKLLEKTRAELSKIAKNEEDTP